MTSLPLSLSVETYGWTISVTLPKEGCRVKMRCFLAWENDCREKFIKRFFNARDENINTGDWVILLKNLHKQQCLSTPPSPFCY